MVSYYFSPGPRLGLPKTWAANKGIGPTQFADLAATEGLVPVAWPTTHQTNGTLYAALRLWGPLWCAGYWYGSGHVIVLTGVEDETIYLNDPDGGVAKSDTIAWFNSKLAKIPSSVMRKDPKAS